MLGSVAGALAGADIGAESRLIDVLVLDREVVARVGFDVALVVAVELGDDRAQHEAVPADRAIVAVGGIAQIIVAAEGLENPGQYGDHEGADEKEDDDGACDAGGLLGRRGRIRLRRLLWVVLLLQKVTDLVDASAIVAGYKLVVERGDMQLGAAVAAVQRHSLLMALAHLRPSPSPSG